MCNNTKAISFWNFLKENTIEIPIIQRDYAQGRLGKENLRKNFLADLKNALDSNEIMKLDFVYGSIEKDYLNPLDGQQRLTTLWLLHWYIALRAGELNEENCKIFKKFTYETRISSREFCQNLCNSQKFENFDGNDIVGFIIKQTWFYSAWKQDPTIQSMLRMLGGTKFTDKNGENIIDGIEELFKCPSECVIGGKVTCAFKRYWEELTSDNAPVVFYHLPLKDFGLSDDLYIKMNARGKQLTSFENFKADLIGYITKQSEDESLEESEQAKWKELLDPKNGIPIKLDTDWTYIFWKNKSCDNRVDEIYFAFINRYFLQELICAKKEDNKDLYLADILEEENGSFRHLYGSKSDDSKLQYIGLDKYLFIENKTIPLSIFKSFRDSLNNFYKSAENCNLNKCFPAWGDSKFEFIPKYDEAGNITTLGQKERVVFLAVCRYFEKGVFDETSFKQWMRIVWNIVENSGIETISAMIGAMRLINELSEHAHDIYKFLANPQAKITSIFAKEQIAEEISKAKKILEDSKWEEALIEAEGCPYLKGKIWVLFQDDENTSNELFLNRWKLLRDILSNKDEYYLPKILISYYNKEKPERQIELKKSESNWKILLTNKENGLFYCFRNIILNQINAKIPYQWIKDLAETQLLNNSRNDSKTIGAYGKNIVLWGTAGCRRYVFANEVWGNVIIGNYRDLLVTGKFELQDANVVVPNTNFVSYFDINFKYQNHFFQWWGDSNETQLDVYLMKDDWNGYEERKPPTNDKKTDEDTYYCFRVTSAMEEDTTLFAKELERLISEASNKK